MSSCSVCRSRDASRCAASSCWVPWCACLASCAWSLWRRPRRAIQVVSTALPSTSLTSLTLSLDNQVWSGVWSFCEIAIGIVAACLPTLAVLATKTHLSKVSASVIHLLSLTFRRSHGSSGSNTRASGHSVRENRSDENEYAQLSEWSLARAKSGDSRNPMHQGNSDVSPFVAGSLTERGERSED